MKTELKDVGVRKYREKIAYNKYSKRGNSTAKPHSGGKILREPNSFCVSSTPNVLLTRSYFHTKLQCITHHKNNYATHLRECFYGQWKCIYWDAPHYDASSNAMLSVFSSARPRGRTRHCCRLWQCDGLSLALIGSGLGAVARRAC